MKYFRDRLALIVWVAAALPLGAQTFGEITGHVLDPSSAVISGASISVANKATGQVRTVRTNDVGNYDVPFLVPGEYEIRAVKEGFKTAARGNAIVQVGEVVRIDFALEMGAVSEAVNVTGGAPLVETESTAVGTVIENKRIVDLPLNGRDYLQLIALSTNVSAEQQKAGFAVQRQGGDRSQQAFSIAGQRMVSNHFTLDGTENTDVNFNTFMIRPSIDAVEEFKVQHGVYSAEYGRNSAQVNVNTKSGSNAFHGTAFEFLRNDALDAKSWLQTGPNSPFRRNQYGFTFGGPIRHNRLFFTANYEALRDHDVTRLTANVPTAQMRAGDFNGTGSTIFDPLTRTYSSNGTALTATAFPNNAIPASRISPINKKLLEFYPAQTIVGNNLAGDYVRQASWVTNYDQFTQRLDWTESAKSNWFGRFSWNDEFAGQATAFENGPTNGFTRVYQAVVSNARIFSPTLVNEARFGFSYFGNELLTFNANKRNVISELGIAGLPDVGPTGWGAPWVTLSNGITNFGDSLNGPFVNHNAIFQGLDNVSIIRGSHTIKVGVELRRDRFNQYGNQYTRGQFSYNGSSTFNPASRLTTGHSLADFLIGKPYQVQIASGLANALLRSTSLAGYVEDNWKITPRLTLTAGLRYENVKPYHDKYRGIINAQLTGDFLDPKAVPIMSRVGPGNFYDGMSFHYADGVPTQVGHQGDLSAHNANFAPRVGLAYSPNSRWSIRTGFGVFFIQDIGNAIFDMARNYPGLQAINGNVENPNIDLANPMLAATAGAGCSNWSLQCVSKPTPNIALTNMKSPYLEQWIFNVQRQLTGDMVLETGYEGSEGHHLQRFMVYNYPLPKTGPNDTSTNAQRTVWPVYGRFQALAANVDSNYHALNLKLTKRFSKGLTYLVGFTWSKAIDDGSGVRQDPGDDLTPPNPFDISMDRGLSQFHVGRRMVSSLVYELPFGSGKRFGNWSGLPNKIIGGWQVGSIITFADGSPINVGAVNDPHGVGNSNCCRPDATGISPIPTDRSAAHFWNIKAFNTASPSLLWDWGTTGRNTLISPGLRNWDFSLLKNTPIREGHTLEFRFEAFNFSNHPNWNSPSSSPTNPTTFGVVTTARTMRQLQLALKYRF